MNKVGKRMFGKFMKLKCIRLIGFSTLAFFAILAMDISGALRHLQEKSFEAEFAYPLESKHFVDIVDAFRLGKPIDTPPINNMYSSISINADNIDKCSDEQRHPLIILVKSAPSNLKQRQAIRETWMIAAIESNAKVVFFIGNPQLEDEEENDKITEGIHDEYSIHKDIVKLDFVDSYYNNTIKTMLEMRWAVEMCANFDFALLIDDDYFLSVKNLMKFASNPLEYPGTSESHLGGGDKIVSALYGGYRMFPPPHRHKIFTKWFVSLDEYPYDYFPPYVTAGAILLSKTALSDIFYASFFTAHFRFDDVYVAICAKKMNITPTHSEYFRFWSTRSDSPEEYLIASHGYDDPDRLHRFWRSQKEHGFC